MEYPIVAHEQQGIDGEAHADCWLMTGTHDGERSGID